VQRAFKINLRRGNKYFKGDPNISMFFVPGDGGGSKYFNIFGQGRSKIGGPLLLVTMSHSSLLITKGVNFVVGT